MGLGIYDHALIDNLITTEEGEYVSILEWIEQEINKSSQKKFITNISYMKKVLGPEFIKKTDDAVRVSIRYTLQKYNIRVASVLCDDGDIKLTMSYIINLIL
jgi:hypothetical protein